MRVFRTAPEDLRCLVLNADYQPLSYYPLSTWPWQEAIKAVFLERVDIVSEYDTLIRSPSVSLPAPSVVALRDYISQDRPPAFTRFNLFLRDGFRCQYCGTDKLDLLTFDHVIPRAYGGRTTWDNIATACAPCNLKKGRTHAARGQDAPAPAGRAAEHASAAGPGPPLPAQVSARELAGLSLLGCRTGKLTAVPIGTAAMCCFNETGEDQAPFCGAAWA